MNSFDLDAPQLGEHVWHAFTGDTSIAADSVAHRDHIASAAAKYLPLLDLRGARLLEVGAYRHYTGHLLASERGAEYFATDIAAAALRDGRAQALANGVQPAAQLVVADFHDLPFATDYFDAVFVAASVHHTRRPEQVLREMLRVSKPGGLVILANEPCARVCCFHAFACNRAESLTPFETEMQRSGMLPTLSSPFWGSRPEHLFGMVENDRIPLSLYMEVFAQEGKVLERTLTEHALIGPFERALMALRAKGPALRAQVRSQLRTAVALAATAFGETERLLEYRLPTECDIHALAGTVAHLLAQRRHAVDDDEWRAEMFGAALAAVVRKNARDPGADTRPATGAFRRDMTIEPDGLVRERSDSSGLAGGLATPLLPDLHACVDGAELEPWFPNEHWQWVRADNGERSMANLAAFSRIDMAPRSTRTLLLMRYFALVTDGLPYWVRIWAGDRLLDEQLIVLQESRLVRAWVPDGSAEISVEIAALGDAPMEIPWRIRVGVFQLFAAD